MIFFAVIDSLTCTTVAVKALQIDLPSRLDLAHSGEIFGRIYYVGPRAEGLMGVQRVNVRPA